MKKVLNPQIEAGSRESNGPRLVGSIVKEVLQGWNTNTALCVNVKTLLRSDGVIKSGKDYHGILRRDEECEEFRYDEHYTFVECVRQTAGKRNVHVFKGRYVTVTRRDDGSYRPNFKPLKVDADFSLERYALGVYNELCIALGGLIEEE